jgi:hypothetical protein
VWTKIQRVSKKLLTHDGSNFFYQHHLVQKLMYTLLFIVIITKLDDLLLSEHMF